MENSSGGRRAGRRPGPTATRDDILQAARQEFADRAYDGATIRAIAASAGVDPALVIHYFGSKRDLFLAALDLPFNPGEIAVRAFAGERGTAAERLLRAALTTWDEAPAPTPIIALLRSAMTDAATRQLLHEYLRHELLEPITRAIGPGGDVTAALLGAQMVGLIVARYIVRIEPIASMPRERLVALLAPHVQALLDLDPNPSSEVSDA